MSKGIYKHKPHQGFQRGHDVPIEWKEGLSERNKRLGIKPPSNLGKETSDITKRKISKALKRIGHKPPSSLGRKHSEASKIKMSKIHRGENSYLWRGGISPINELIRKGIEFRLWREAVFARDNWTCQKYGTKGGKLHPHHIQNFSNHPELRFAIDNGITLSEKAHREFHKKYGLKNNTQKQLEEFLLKCPAYRKSKP